MTALAERLSGARRVASVLALAVLVAALVPFVVFAVPQVIGADHGFVILSGSMEPTVSPGDVVIVDASAPIAVGDVITYDDGNEVPTTHRVVDVEDGQYVTKGDANQNLDAQRVAPSDVLGRVALTIPFVGYVILWVNTPVGYVSLVVAPLVLLVADELLSWARSDGDADDGDDPAPTPAIRPLAEVRAERAAAEDDTNDADPSDDAAESGEGPETVSVAVADLKLTALAMVGLVGYAAWNVYREVTVAGAPDPISTGALTGGLLGLGFAVWVTASARLAATATDDDGDTETETVTTTDRPASAPTARADGGTEEDR